MQILRSIELDTTTQMSSIRNKLQQKRKKMTLRESSQTKIQKQVKRLTEEEPEDRSEATSESNESIHNIKK